MKRTLIICTICCMAALPGLSQSLAGEWNGFYNYYYGSGTMVAPASDMPLKLKITVNSDSTYKIISYSGRGEEETECAVYYRKLSEDSVFLQEMRVMKPEGKTNTGLQMMYLKISRRKKTMYLEGTWRFSPGDERLVGEIYLYKKD